MKPARIRISQGVVHNIAVSVVVLRIQRELQEWIRRCHAAQLLIVEAAIHVDQGHVVQVLVPGIAPLLRRRAGRGTYPVCRITPLPKGIVKQPLDAAAVIVHLPEPRTVRPKLEAAGNVTQRGSSGQGNQDLADLAARCNKCIYREIT